MPRVVILYHGISLVIYYVERGEGPLLSGVRIFYKNFFYEGHGEKFGGCGAEEKFVEAGL